ncbi:MAG: 2-hydroxyacid dehydrogenase [Candidatus Levyibacteriota bacterium]
MKFNKATFIGISKSSLEQNYWKRINKLTKEKVFLPKNSLEIKKHLADTDCLLVGFGVNVSKEDIDKAPHLKYIGVFATAYGKIDSEYAKKKKVIVCNLAGYSTESVAEFVLAAILEVVKGICEGKRRGKTGNYSEAGISAFEIKDKIFGVIGLGHIGTRIAELALGLGADVRYWSRNRKRDAEKKGIRYEELNKLISKSDFVSINLALNKETENIFNKKRFQEVKKGAVIINTAPMELVNIEGLVKRLEKKDITFVLDHSDEMSQKDLKNLSKYENCIIYPPMAYITKEAGIMRQEMFTSNIENFLKGKPTNKVN